MSSNDAKGREPCKPRLPVALDSSYGFRNPPPPVPSQQQQLYSHRHHSPQSIREGEIPSISEISSTQGAYRAEMATGMMFDTFIQWSMDSLSMGMGSSSTPPPSSSSSLMENVFRRTGTGMIPHRFGGHSYHQPQTLSPQQEQWSLTYPFVFGNNAIATPSNAQTGFDHEYVYCCFSLFNPWSLIQCHRPFMRRLNEQGAYLANNIRHHPLISSKPPIHIVLD